MERVRVVIACAARALRVDACCRLYGAEMRHPGVEKDVAVLWYEHSLFSIRNGGGAERVTLLLQEMVAAASFLGT